jgi:hypothetical protein
MAYLDFGEVARLVRIGAFERKVYRFRMIDG